MFLMSPFDSSLKSEPIEEIPYSKSMQEADDQLEETLSLCDLPMYSHEGEKEYSAASQGSNSLWTSDHDQDGFEFFSEELNSFPPENIIFCGKLITSKKPISENPIQVENKQQGSRKWRFRRLFRWKFNSSKKSPGVKSKKQHILQNRYGVPYKKVSVLTSSSSGKSRWYLFLFGITRFPTEMELRDLKNRQSRRHRREPSPAMFQLKHRDEKTNVRRNSCRGLWGLIKALSCGGGGGIHQTNAVVAAPLSCIPPPPV